MSDFSNGTGYEDWRRVQSLVSDPLVDVTVPNCPVTSIYGPFYVAAYPTTRVIFNPNSGGNRWQVTVNWYADQALADPITSFQWFVSSYVPLLDAVPNLGPWMEVTIENDDWTGAEQFFLSVLATTASAVDCRTPPQKTLSSVQALTVNAGVTQKNIVSYETTGPAMLNVQTTAVSWTCGLYAVWGGVTTQSLGQLNVTSSSPFGPMAVLLPAYPVQVWFTNNDASSKFYSYSLMVP